LVIGASGVYSAQIAASIDRAGVRPFPLHNQSSDHIMTTIAAKQNALENFASATDWMASFLDFQISKLEERCEDIDTGMDAKLPETNRNPTWN
jgi:hypothetical protein